MRIVHIITRLIVGGAQENTLLTAAGQVRDHADEVVLVTGPGDDGPEGNLLESDLVADLAVHLVPQMGRAIRPWRDWSSFLRIKKILAEIRPDIVHTHSSKAGILGRTAASQLKLPVVHTVHGSAFHRGQSWLAQSVFRRAERWAARRCDRLISVCDSMTDQYVAAKIAPREKFTTVYSGMDVEPFLSPSRSREDVRAELGLAETDIVVGKIARLFDLKGHRYLLDAAAAILRRQPDVKFLLVGDGPLRSRFQQRLDRDGLSDRFIFTGLVPPERVPELITAMDLVVHTSVWEGLARVLPQSMIGGRPVISFDIDGASEVVIPGETGLLLPPESVNELIEAVCTLAADAQLRDRLGETGRARWTETFRHETMTRRVREVYQDVLSK